MTTILPRPLDLPEFPIYGESFKGAEHLAQVQEAAKQVVSDALNG